VARTERNMEEGIIIRRKTVGKYWRREKEDAKRWKRRDETERLEIEDGWRD